MKKQLILGLAACLITNLGFADILVDRGLPTANLNQGFDSTQSNIAWETGNVATRTGDTFANTSSQTWNITQITLWTVGKTLTANLFGGVSGSTISQVASGVITAGITYANGATYQVPSGAFAGIAQVDFAVNLTLAPGEVYNFFLDGNGGQSGPNFSGVPFLHSSNAGLSGSPQDGADGFMLDATVDGANLINPTPWTSAGNGWNKATDANVRVSGTAVPDSGSTLALMGVAFAGIAALRRKFLA